MKKLMDLTGDTYGRLTVEGRAVKDGYWRCRCACGNTKDVRAGNLRSGQVASCGCLHRDKVKADLVGRRFVRLLVVESAGSNHNGSALWHCLCDCGSKVVVQGGNLRNGNSKSCGCLRVDVARGRSLKHGMSASPDYKRWDSIKQRCTNPNNPRYADYGGRGITMCPEWAESFDAFYEAVGPCPEGMTLDREDNDRGYEIGNVRWATRSEQQRNRRPYKRVSRADVEALKVKLAASEAQSEALEARIAALEAEIAALRAEQAP